MLRAICKHVCWLVFCGYGFFACAEESQSLAAQEDALLLQGENIRVTKSDLDAEIRAIPKQYRGDAYTSPKVLAQLIDKIAKRRVIANEARKMQLPARAEVKKALQIVEEEALFALYLEEVEKKVVADFASKTSAFEKRAREIYAGNPDKYRIADKYKASHILLKTEKRTDDQAKELLSKLKADIMAGKADFQELAVKYSEDPSVKDNKGDLGFFELNAMVKPFSQAVAGMKPEEISKPVQTRFGWHLIKLFEVKQGKTIEFSQVQSEILDELETKFIERSKMDKVNELVNKADLKVVEGALEQDVQNKAPLDLLKIQREAEKKLD